MHFWYWIIALPILGLLASKITESITNLWNRS